MSISHNDLHAMFTRSHGPRRRVSAYACLELAACAIALSGWAFAIICHWSR